MDNLWTIYGQSMEDTIMWQKHVVSSWRLLLKNVEKCWWDDMTCVMFAAIECWEIDNSCCPTCCLVHHHGNAGFGFHIVLSLFIVSKQMVSEPQLCKYLIVHLWFSDSQAYQPPSQDFIYVVFFESRPKQWPSPMSLSAKWPTSTM